MYVFFFLWWDKKHVQAVSERVHHFLGGPLSSVRHSAFLYLVVFSLFAVFFVNAAHVLSNR